MAGRIANPRNVALIFLTKSEHGLNSPSILVNDSEDLGKKVIKIVLSLIEDLP